MLLVAPNEALLLCHSKPYLDSRVYVTERHDPMACKQILRQTNPCQAFNVPFNLLSASDPNLKGRILMCANCRCAATHWHKDLASQARDAPCALHPYANSCVSQPVAPDLAICGTPCHPYSTQRSGRFDEASVESHHEFEVAMSQFMQWLHHMQPKAQVFEQVDGFMMPFNKQTVETPFERRCMLFQSFPGNDRDRNFSKGLL